jgi:hypothetical protein
MDMRDEVWPWATCDCGHRDYAHLQGMACIFECCDCKWFQVQPFFIGPDEIVEEGPSEAIKKAIDQTPIPCYSSDEYEAWLYTGAY